MKPRALSYEREPSDQDKALTRRAMALKAATDELRALFYGEPENLPLAELIQRAVSEIKLLRISEELGIERELEEEERCPSRE